MKEKRGWLAMGALLLLVALVVVVSAAGAAGSKERFQWAIADKLTVLEGGMDVLSTLTMNDNVVVAGTADAIQLQVTGSVTQTSDLLLLEQYGGTDRFTVNEVGRTDIVFERDGLTGYDYGFVVEGAATGVAGGAKTRAVMIEVEREAGYEIQSGDMEDVGLMVRVDTHAITTTAGTVLRGVDSEAKADNPSGTVTNLYGGSFTAKSDTGAGSVGTMVALSTNVQNNAAVDDYLVSLDARSMRQAATEPTEEYIIHVRQGNTTGTGVDAGIYIESDGTGETDDFNYGLDMSAAEIDDGDIRLQNGSILDEGTDGVATFSEFFGFAEQTAEVVGAGATIVPTGTYQPITSAAGVTCNTTTCITAGTFMGQLLILVNENASDTITIDGTGGNVECKSDVVLGAQDSLTLLWNGADWICLSGYDNS